MRRFLLISLVLPLAATVAKACVSEGPTYNHYMYSIVERNNLDGTRTPGYVTDIAAFWQSYAGLSASGGELTSTYYSDHAADIAKAALRKGDKAMTAYLGLLDRYLRVVEGTAVNRWDYRPMPKAQRELSLGRLLASAKAYRGTALRQQYALLTMRAYMLLGNYRANIAYWKSTASRLAASPWREAMRGIYANALLHTGDKLGACDVYAAQEDWLSMKWAMRHYRNLAGIKTVYAHNPDAPSLAYLVQDFVNNVQETIDQAPLTAPSELREWLRLIDSQAIFSDEARSFVSFASQVVADGKCASPAMWESAAAMVCYLLGDHMAAGQHADAAVGLGGSQRVRDNARAIRLLVSTAIHEPDSQYSAFVTRELQWIDGKIAEESASSRYYCGHYVDVKERVVHRGLIPMLTRAGNRSLALTLHAMCDANSGDDALRRAKDSGEHDFDWWTNGNPNNVYSPMDDYCAALDTLTATQLRDYYGYLSSESSDPLATYARHQAYRDSTYFSDRIGTKYLAEGRFAEALEWLDKVPLRFVQGQRISLYMAHRSYEVPRWLVRQPVSDTDTDGMPRKAVPRSNAKADFCRYMNALLAQYGVARPGDTQDSIAYKLATAYFQASCYGDCWYLTRYYHSVGDTVLACEKDFAAEAVRYLEVCGRSQNIDMRRTALYALAYIPTDPWRVDSYDADYNVVTTVRPDARQYKAYAALTDLLLRSPAAADDPVSRCDVLRQFAAARHGD